MKIISGGRGTGKTAQLLKELAAKKENCYVVCNNPKKMNERALADGIFNVKFIDIDDVFEDVFSEIAPLYIDDISDFLIGLFGERIKGYTVATD